MIKSNTPAPTKLSEAIRMALKDQLAVEKNPKIEIDMNTWHTALEGKPKCAVCFAGAVMHQQFYLTLGSTAYPNSFPLEWRMVFMALNAVRSGRVKEALLYMGGTLQRKAAKIAATIKVSSPMPDYHISRTKFRKEMRSIAKQLEEKGL